MAASRPIRLLAAVAAALLAAAAGSSATAADPYLRLVRVVGADEPGNLPHGLAFGPRRVALDPAAGRRYALDQRRPKVVVSPLETPSERLDALDLGALREPGGAIALDASRRRLHVLSGDGTALVEITTGGRTVTSRNLSALRLDGPVDMAFAPSGDPTDPPETLSLYLAFGHEERRRTLELELEQPALAALPPPERADLVRVVETSRWSPPSPDPSGIAFLPSSGRLIVSDAEVEEIPRLFAGANVFETSRNGALVATAGTLAFSDEPTGLAADEAGGRLFFSDDDRRRVHEVRLGPDGRLGTADDAVTTLSTRTFGSTDPEGLAFGGGRLFVADGLGREIYILAPGPNGRFDGAPPDGDDLVEHFDTAALGQQDPEGVEYNAEAGTLFIVSNTRRTTVVEVTLAGAPVRVLDISAAAIRSPAGLAYAPGAGATRSLFIVDRNVDNAADPNENDGRMFELSIPAGRPAPTGVPTPGPDSPAIRETYLPLVGH